MKWKRFSQVLKQTGEDFAADDCMSSGAAIAYYTIFSLPPLLAIVFALATRFWSVEEVTNVIDAQLGLPLEQNVAASDAESQKTSFNLLNVVERAHQSGEAKPPGWARIMGIGILLFSACGVLAQLQAALNKAWNVEPDPQAGGVKQFIRKRLLSLGMLVVMGLLLLISLVLTTLVDEFTRWLQGGEPSGGMLLLVMAINNLIALALASLLFAATFRILPDAKIEWRDVFIGASVTALLFVIGKSGIGWYLQFSHAGSSWGSAAASMIGILIWVYYSSLIILLGAEFTQSWAIYFGRGLEAAEGAVLVTEEKNYHREAREVVLNKKEREGISG